MFILLAIFPLAASASLLAWSDYRAQVDLSGRRVSGTLAIYLASERADLETADRSLGALSRLIPLDGEGCTKVVDLASELADDRYAGLAVITPGRVLCGAGVAVSERGSEVPNGFGQAIRLPDGSIAVPMAHHLSADPRWSVVADVRLRPPSVGSASLGAWLVDRVGRTVSLLPSRQTPPAWTSSGPVGTDSPRVIRTVGSKQGLFFGGSLPGDNLVVVGDRATREESLAAHLFVERIVVIAAILAAGVVLVTIGAHITVVAPIQALTRRVTGWRTAGQFDDASVRFVPAELAELVDAFGLATRSLALREKELEKARLEQELALKEIHHRVKNNLQIIASLLNLQANRIRLPEAKAEFQSARDRVRALATLHRHLYKDGGLYTIAMRSFLLELCGQLFQAIGEREGHRIRLEVDAPELEISSDQAVPLALIVTEAVSNAVKYAFPGGRSGLVSVRLCLLGGERISLTVQDDGVGMPAGQAETETGVRDGLGIQLIRGFAKQLGATLEVTEGAGTRYYLELQLLHREGERERVTDATS